MEASSTFFLFSWIFCNMAMLKLKIISTQFQLLPTAQEFSCWAPVELPQERSFQTSAPFLQPQSLLFAE